MEINEENAKKMFKEKYPSGVGYDFVGRKMKYENYGCTNSEYGWNIDHILPVSRGGTDDNVNLQCTNIVTNETKEDKTTWQDDDRTWQVRRVKGNKKAHKVVEVK